MLRFIVFNIIFLFIANETILAACTSPLMGQISHATTKFSHAQESPSELTFKNKAATSVLIGPKKIFNKQVEMMLEAKSDIFFQTWLFEPNSEAGQTIMRGLQKLKKKLQAEGRQLHLWMLINNTQLNARSNSLYEKKLLVAFKKYGLNSGPLITHYLIFKANLLGAYHAKSLIIDRRKAMILGANVSYKNDGVGMYDLGLVIEGDAVNSTLEDFRSIWNSHSLEKLNLEHLAYHRGSGPCLPILYASTYPVNTLISSQLQKSLTIAVLTAIHRAKKSIDIITPNLNNKLVEEAILNAISRGVRVRILLSLGFEEAAQSVPGRGGANRYTVQSFYKKLKVHRNRKAICEALQIKWYSLDGRKPSVGAKQGNSHAKYMVVDGQVSYFGSINMDNQSFINSREIGILVDSKKLSSGWSKQAFAPVFKKGFIAKECSRNFGVTDDEYYFNKKPKNNYSR